MRHAGCLPPALLVALAPARGEAARRGQEFLQEPQQAGSKQETDDQRDNRRREVNGIRRLADRQRHFARRILEMVKTQDDKEQEGEKDEKLEHERGLTLRAEPRQRFGPELRDEIVGGSACLGRAGPFFRFRLGRFG